MRLTSTIAACVLLVSASCRDVPLAPEAAAPTGPSAGELSSRLILNDPLTLELLASLEDRVGAAPLRDAVRDAAAPAERVAEGMRTPLADARAVLAAYATERDLSADDAVTLGALDLILTAATQESGSDLEQDDPPSGAHHD